MEAAVIHTTIATADDQPSGLLEPRPRRSGRGQRAETELADGTLVVTQTPADYGRSQLSPGQATVACWPRARVADRQIRHSAHSRSESPTATKLIPIPAGL